MNHYVYRITNKLLRKHYYGKRSCKSAPSSDIGHRYFSSSKDKAFTKDQKINPDNYLYKIVGIYNSSSKALKAEIKLHNKFKVDINPSFYNLSIQTSDKWSTKDKVIVKTADGTPLCVPANHPDYLSGVLVGINTGRTWSDSSKLKASKSRRGTNNSASIFVNIYDYKTDKLIAEKVLVSAWCKDNNYNQGHLAKTVKADRGKPHCSNSIYKDRVNPHHHKGIYAKVSN